VINNTEVPRNAKVSLKLQKKSVPNMDTENIAMEVAWWEFKPKVRLRKNKPVDKTAMAMAFLNNLSIP